MVEIDKYNLGDEVKRSVREAIKIGKLEKISEEKIDKIKTVRWKWSDLEVCAEWDNKGHVKKIDIINNITKKGTLITDEDEIKKIIGWTNTPCYCCGNRLVNVLGSLFCAGSKIEKKCKYVDGKDCKPDGNCGGKDYFTRSKHSEAIR